jgi:hypothetical protein
VAIAVARSLRTGDADSGPTEQDLLGIVDREPAAPRRSWDLNFGVVWVNGRTTPSRLLMVDVLESKPTGSLAPTHGPHGRSYLTDESIEHATSTELTGGQASPTKTLSSPTTLPHFCGKSGPHRSMGSSRAWRSNRTGTAIPWTTSSSSSTMSAHAVA